MKKFSKVLNDKKFTWILMGLGTIMILFYYLRNVPHINTVWELVDEYGYLANAAYLSGTEWEWVTNHFYGYGYSLWLVPLFWICDTGTGLIRGAVLINILFIVALFWVQYILMSKVYKTLNKNIVVLLSLLLCFYPYMISSSMKVVCECLLTLMVWVCGLLLYQALESEKWYYYVLLAIANAYTFFVHTRALVFCAVLFLVVAVMFLKKKVSVKNLLYFAAISVVVFVLGFILKNHIIDAVYSNVLFESGATAGTATSVTVKNTLSVAFVLRKIWKFIADFSMQHIYSFACKNFYLFVGTAGMFHVGIYAIVKSITGEWKENRKLNSAAAIKLLYGMAIVVMLLALIVTNPGLLDTPSYFFYGRYYEYLIGPMVFAGIHYCIANRLHIVEGILLFAGFVFSYYVAIDLVKHLEVGELYFDSTRIAAFSYSAYEKIMYLDVLEYWLKFTLVAMALIFVFTYIKSLRIVVPIVLFYIFMLNDTVIANTIVHIHQTNTNFYEVTAFIHSYYDVDEVFFLKGDAVETIEYAGIQVLLGKEKLNVITVDDEELLEAGDLIITYGANQPIDQLDMDSVKIAECRGYKIYLTE